MSVVLGANRYGKAENRVVRVYRDTARHEIRDLNVSTSLRGDLEDAHVAGDQTKVLPTDTQKNTAFAYAKQHGVTSPEDYAIALGTHFLDAAPPATGAQIATEEYVWDRRPGGPSRGRGDQVLGTQQAPLPGRPGPIRPGEQRRGVHCRGPTVWPYRGVGVPRRLLRGRPCLAVSSRLHLTYRITSPHPRLRQKVNDE